MQEGYRERQKNQERENNLPDRGLHKMNIFLDKANNIGLDKNIFEFLRSEPFIAYKSLFSSGTWFIFSRIFYEKEGNFLMDNRSSLEVSSDK